MISNQAANASAALPFKERVGSAAEVGTRVAVACKDDRFPVTLKRAAPNAEGKPLPARHVLRQLSGVARSSVSPRASSPTRIRLAATRPRRRTAPPARPRVTVRAAASPKLSRSSIHPDFDLRRASSSGTFPGATHDRRRRRRDRPAVRRRRRVPARSRPWRHARVRRRRPAHVSPCRGRAAPCRSPGRRQVTFRFGAIPRRVQGPRGVPPERAAVAPNSGTVRGSRSVPLDRDARDWQGVGGRCQQVAPSFGVAKQVRGDPHLIISRD